MTFVILSLSAAFAWWLFFWLYRSYRLDLFRERLFDIRDRLFLMAADGELAFDHPAYGMLRRTLNGTIRMGHQWSIGGLLAFRTIAAGSVDVAEYQAEWKFALESLPEATAGKLKKLRSELHYHMLEQLLFTSAILFFTLVAMFIWLASQHVLRARFFDRLSGLLDAAGHRTALSC